MKTVLFQSIYRLSALLFLAAALTTFLLMFGVFPDTASALGLDDSHLVQEFGCALAALGCLAWWLSGHLSQGRFAHGLLLLFFALFALVHWVDFFKGHVPVASGLINSIPVAVFALMLHYYDFDRQPGVSHD